MWSLHRKVDPKKQACSYRGDLTDQLWLFVLPILDHIPFNSQECTEISQALNEALTGFDIVNLL